MQAPWHVEDPGQAHREGKSRAGNGRFRSDWVKVSAVCKGDVDGNLENACLL